MDRIVSVIIRESGDEGMEPHYTLLLLYMLKIFHKKVFKTF